VLGNPVTSVAWLSNKLWEYGVPLRSGEIILSGAITAAPPAAKGDSFEARFSDFGVVVARFV
jgi:2-keto-4-pentenoate hydratase